MNAKQHHKNTSQNGFTLMEVLIVIIIIGILAAIAIPSYQRYLNKSRVTSAIVLTGPARLAVTEHAILHNGDLATVNNSNLNLSNAQLIGKSTNVSAITISGIDNDSAKVVAVLADNLGTLTWTGTYDPTLGDISWACTYPKDDSIASYAPKSCQSA